MRAEKMAVRDMTQKIFSIALVSSMLFLNLVLDRAHAEVTLCAKVKVEIQQELTLERQAFDAKMVITNGLTDFSLDEVKIDVIFEDSEGNLVTATSNPNDLNALFFIVVSSMNGINSVSNGTIAPQGVAEIHWLIIPATGAAADSPLGALYYVGAKVSYKTNGELTEIDIAPDNITVLPQPELALDYFLPADVYGDDPLTVEIEPIVPFTLGVRVKNDGLGDANKLKISSSQPKIVDNQLGLFIDFKLIGSFVNDDAVQPTLKLDFGNIEAGTSKVGRWLMQTTLAGKFTDFDATFTHSDALGGALTSLIKSIDTHTLVKDVLVDLPGRDTVKDFLTKDILLYRMFESEGIDSTVTDLSTFVSVTPQGPETFVIQAPPTAGLLYLAILDPYLGTKTVQSVVRGDGKVIALTNAWFFAQGLGTLKKFYFGLFDANGGGSYTVKLGNPQNNGNLAPVIVPIPDKKVQGGALVKFDVQASDPNSTIPVLTAELLPIGATFTPAGNGTGQFSWKTKKVQDGSFPVTFKATDGSLIATETVLIKITKSIGEPPQDPEDPIVPDTDGDGLTDAWELEYFGDLNETAHGDFDGDGLTNGREKKMGTDPTWALNAPTVPFIVSPLYHTKVDSLKPRLKVVTSAHGVQVPTYEFEVATDLQFINIVDSKDGVSEKPGETSWKVTATLQEDHHYYWRARAKVPAATSNWVYGDFIVDTAFTVVGPQPSPTPWVTTPSYPATKRPRTENPAPAARVDSLRPRLSILPNGIPHVSAPQYRFQIFADADLQKLVHEGTTTDRFWTPAINLKQFSKYFWRVRTEKVTGQKISPWSEVSSFFVSKDAINDPPQVKLIAPVGTVYTKQGKTLSFVWTVLDPDSIPASALTINGGSLVGFAVGAPELGDNYVFDFKNIIAPPGKYVLKLSASDELATVDATETSEVTITQ
jgi:hypothetical protein